MEKTIMIKYPTHIMEACERAMLNEQASQKAREQAKELYDKMDNNVVVYNTCGNYFNAKGETTDLSSIDVGATIVFILEYYTENRNYLQGKSLEEKRSIINQLLDNLVEDLLNECFNTEDYFN